MKVFFFLTCAFYLITASIISGQSMDGILFDTTTNKVHQAVLEASRAQSIYAYNIANLSTPGFKPILLEEDRRVLQSLFPEDPNNKIMMEHFMARLTENRSRHSALTKLFSIKLGIMRQIATLGKR